MPSPAELRHPEKRGKQRFVVFAFSSTRESLDAEEALISAGVPHRVMPLPPHRGRLCGIALRLEPSDEVQGVEAIQRAGMVVQARDEIEDY